MKLVPFVLLIVCVQSCFSTDCCDEKNGCCAGKNYCLIDCNPNSCCCDCCADSCRPGMCCCCSEEACGPTEEAAPLTSQTNAIKELTSQEAFDKTIKDHAIVVVDFHATWCGPCRQQDPILQAIAEKYQNVHFVKLNIDEEENKALSESYGIDRIPTLLFFQNGTIKKCLVGIQQKEQLTSTLDTINK